MGGTEFEFKRKLQAVFAKVKTEKPDASRKQSTEGFFVAVGYKPLKKEIIQPAASDEKEEQDLLDTTIINKEDEEESR
jgi:23S rRNA (uridine2552-2'-O)-methyltransferase